MAPVMENRTDITLAEQYTATLEWWRDAGVDCAFSDEPQSWLAEPEQQAGPTPPKTLETTPPEEISKPAISEADLPQDLPAFREWWLDQKTELPSGAGPRIGPRGKLGAPILLLAPMPEADDRDALLSGPQGRMLANIAKALGVVPEDAYYASALPTHMPLPDWDNLLIDGLGAAVARHVSLAKPERVIVFGSKLPALLGHEAAAPPEQLTEIAGIPALATFAPERLLAHARQRARLWQRLLAWTA